MQLGYLSLSKLTLQPLTIDTPISRNTFIFSHILAFTRKNVVPPAVEFGNFLINFLVMVLMCILLSY